MTTIAQAFTLKEAPLAKCEGNVKASVKIHLAALSRFLNTRLTLTDEHIDFIADRMLNDEYYKWLKPADLKVFFDGIKTGRYGDFYGNLNTIAFFQALDTYMIERNAEIERLRIDEAKRQREDMRSVDLSYYIGKDNTIVRKPEYEDKPAPKKDNADKATRVAHMAKVYVSQGMDYSEAIEKAAELLENVEKGDHQ